ncbi:MAG: hypothetical protein EG822_07165 [Deltaproteobacteria bacterium]|nr:hypothetical protein [Deltaproteobacteria bacterium]TLN00598.1 MAG: hypothetical protein FDZ73_18910 [bacterium]
MTQYKNIIDILSSMASFIAIIGVMVSWYKSAQKPLKIDRVVIHKKETENTFILVVKNRKNYPVEIKSISCYRKPKYQIQKKNNQKPEYMKLLSLSDSYFSSSEHFEIGANGHTDIRVKCGPFSGQANRLLFSIYTSHGYHEIWCKDILEVDIGKTEVYGLEYQHEYQSKYRAKIQYYWLRLLESLK